MNKKIISIVVLLSLVVSVFLYAQGSGTPNTLQVMTDATGALVAAGVLQTLPLSQPGQFTNTQLRTDSTGALVVTLVSGGGGNTVTNHAYYIGTGTSATTAVGPCNTNQVPHGVTGADPACGSILEAYLGLTDITTANASSSAHGFLPKLSGNAYDFFLGDGTYGRTVARGTITTSSPWAFTQTWNASGVVFSGLEVNVTRTASANLSTPLKVTMVGIGDVFSVTQDGLLSNNDKVKLSLNANATAVASSFDFQIVGGSNQVIFANTAETVQRPIVARNLLLGGNYASGNYPTIIGGDQYAGIQFASARRVTWSDSATSGDAGSLDTGMSRSAAGLVEFNNGTTGTFRDAKLRHLLGAGTAPTVADDGNCGTTAPTIVGTDTGGVVTVGATSGSQCVVTFGTAYANAPACAASGNTTGAGTGTTTGTLTIKGTFAASETISFICVGR